MKLKYNLLWLAFLLIIPSDISSQSINEKLDSYLTEIYNRGQLSGAVLVGDDDKILFKKGFGYANIEWGISNTTDTKFRLASVTKQFTAVLVLQQVEEGKINLDGKITDYIPSYSKKNGDKITIHHLLSHTSGMPHYQGVQDFFPEKSRQPYTHEDFVKLFSDLDLLFEPGTKFSYSSFGYYLLGFILEIVTGKSYGDLLKEKIFDPVEMNNSSLDDNITVEMKRASGYDKIFDEITNAEFRDMSTALATGDIISTVEDLFKWHRALNTNKLLSDSSKELLFRPNIQGYAYGFYTDWLSLGDNDSVYAVFHSGGTVGFESLIIRYINDDKVSILLCNNVPSLIYPVSTGIRNIIYGYEPEYPKIPVRDVVAEKIFNASVEEAVERYKFLRDNHPDEYDFREFQLNTLGYYLLGKDMIDDAIEVFKLNVEMFPDAFNTYDSLGEAYMIKGNNNLAIINYQKSVDLNPDNVNGKKYLEQLKSVSKTE